MEGDGEEEGPLDVVKLPLGEADKEGAEADGEGEVMGVGVKMEEAVEQGVARLEAVKEGDGVVVWEVEGEREAEAHLLTLPLTLPLGVRLSVVVGASEVRGEGEVVWEPLACSGLPLPH